MSTVSTTEPDAEVDTCPADKGCCKCDESEKESALNEGGTSAVDETDTTLEKAQFENTIQNIVFVQR